MTTLRRDPQGDDPLGPGKTPYELLGGRERVLSLAERFYDIMEEQEPALAALHACDAPGKVARRARDRFALFLVGWLGGPQDYVAQNGHPRLRMRHAKVRIDIAARDAWLRAMGRAMEAEGVAAPLRAYLEARFAEVADFMRNTPE